MRFIPSFLLVLLVSSPLLGQSVEAVPAPGLHARSLAEAVGYMLLFAALGIAAAFVGYKIFDRLTPGDLHREIVENKNVAAAIVAAAVILGICIIVAAAMIG